MTTTTSPATTVAPNIPLTTLFTPPAWCDSHSWVSSDCPGTNTCTGIYNIVRATETECYPSGWQASATYFSPGICPSGYSTGTNILSYIGASGTETRATCCPRYGSKTVSLYERAWNLTYTSSGAGLLVDSPLQPKTRKTGTNLSPVLGEARALQP